MRLPIETLDSDVSLMCLNCGYQFTKPLGWLDSNRDFSCPADCGAELAVRGNGWRQVRKDVAALGRQRSDHSGASVLMLGGIVKSPLR